MKIQIKALTQKDTLWSKVATYAAACDWRAGPQLAEKMRSSAFDDWERVFAALCGEAVAGFCVFSKRDCIPDVPYTPYIGYVFVDQAFRGHRLSQRMIEAALSYAKTLGFERVYLVSDHKNLYEKYGFCKIDEKPAPWDPSATETIFMRAI